VATADPFTVKHHFLIKPDPVLDERADAEIVNTPDTEELFGVDHTTDGPVLEVALA
jgi:hypothetical protein